MNNILEIINSYKDKCTCGRRHRTSIEDIIIESGAVKRVGEILTKNKFPKNILLVADENTLKAAEGILESLEGFNVTMKIYPFIRVAEMHHVEELEELIKGKRIAVLSVGTGSVNDPCRLACARQKKKLCIFATAPSMDGFASYSSPIVKDGFKESYPAKSPEVIIGDTKILAAAPTELKSSGFGDMIAKYVGLIDWKISKILIGEPYCERVAALTRTAVDELMSMADKVCSDDEYTAGKIFESLLKTGIGMSFMKNSRPASGSEHIIAHLIECKELPEGKIPNLHGEDVGVCTLEMLKLYNTLAEKEKITAVSEEGEWAAIFCFYGKMSRQIAYLNIPWSIADDVDTDILVK